MSIKIKAGKLGYILYIDGIKVNYSECEFCSIKDLRKYWNTYRTLLINGFRHTCLRSYLYGK